MVVPLHKKGDILDPNNYRGITLLPAISKVFCSLLTNRLEAWLEENNLLVSTQCGYRATYSTIDNLYILQTATTSRLKQ